MLVCAHGDVAEFCEKHGMTVVDHYVGEITDYTGDVRVIVTDRKMCAQEFYYLRMVMWSKNYDVRSVHYPILDEKLNEFLEYVGLQEQKRRKERYGGRQPFGYQLRNGKVVENQAMIAVARRIIEMKDAGATLRAIQDDEGVHHLDGRKISLSTIQLIIKNREKYERK